MNNQSKLKNVVITMTATLGLLAPLVASAHAVKGVPGWDIGTNTTTAWSNYKNNSRTHMSTVTGQYFVASAWVSKGYTSYASAPAALWGNEAHYDIK